MPLSKKVCKSVHDTKGIVLTDVCDFILLYVTIYCNPGLHVKLKEKPRANNRLIITLF